MTRKGRSSSRLLQATVLGLALACLTPGCASELTLDAQAARSLWPTTVQAQLSAGLAGTVFTINDPTQLPDAVRQATNLKVRVDAVEVTVTRNPGGSLSFTLPATAVTNPAVNGDLRVVFVLNDIDSQIVDLATGSPVQFDTPPVAVTPGFIVQGLDVQLHANSGADPTVYQFTWSYATSAQGPFAPIPGQGKDITWTPPAQGNYFIMVNAVDRATQQSYATTTSSAVVFVTDTKDVLTTDPASGTVQRGNTVTLKFVQPAGLTGTNLSYAWSEGPSAQGPWTVITGNTSNITWLPTMTGNYFIKSDVSNKDTGKVNTFISPNALVFVTEGTPIVTPSSSNVHRGDRVGLTLNIPNAGAGPFTWYSADSGTASVTGAPSFSLIPNAGTGKQISQVVNDAGSYNYRVDFPDANGNIQSFVTTNPVLTVTQGEQSLITSIPANETITAGDSVKLQLNAAGVDETNYRYTWYYTTNPSFGWTAIPVSAGSNNTKKTFLWKTQTPINTGFNTVYTNVQAGSYFIRVDATPLTGTGISTYTFTSDTPVVTLEPNSSNQ